MKKVAIERVETSDHGTFGVLHTEGLTLFTGELPWLQNMPNYSCIPVGTYKVRWTYSNRFRRQMYLVDKVPDREGIRFHSANLMGKIPLFKAQLNGCIALGERLGVMNKQKALLLSKPAMLKFENHMKREPFTLEVYYG